MSAEVNVWFYVGFTVALAILIVLGIVISLSYVKRVEEEIAASEQEAEREEIVDKALREYENEQEGR